jgi:hypothetical protein
MSLKPVSPMAPKMKYRGATMPKTKRMRLPPFEMMTSRSAVFRPPPCSVPAMEYQGF